MHSRTLVFRRVVRDYMGAVPPVVSPETPLGDALDLLRRAKASGLIVLDEGGHVAGIVTEQDIARRIAFRADATARVADYMTAPVHTIRAGDYLFHAIAEMRRHKLRHLPVTDDSRRPVGLLDLHTAFAAAAQQMTAHVDALAPDGTAEGLGAVKTAQVAVAAELMKDNVPVPEIQNLLTHLNIDIYRRVVVRALAEMADEGWGEPPVNFSVIVMGSGGRGENYIYPDQDNGFILEDYPDDAHGRIDPWFIELGERMTQTLDKVGFPLCKGYVMATNPLWRKTESQWRAQTTLWAKRRGTVALRLSDIFYDFVSVFGEGAYADRLRRHVVTLVQNSPIYLQEMWQDGEDHGVALGWFGRFITEKDVAEHKGEINLKTSGSLPLVEAARLMALKHGILATGTLERLAGLKDAGYLRADEHDYLTGAFRHLTFLLLRQQIADFQAGRKVSNYVPPDSLSTREKDMLIDSFKAIADLRGRLRGEFTGQVL